MLKGNLGPWPYTGGTAQMLMGKGKTKRGAALKFTGIIVPAQWDEQGKAVKIALATTEEEEYIIGPGKKGAELFTLIRKRVEVAGNLREGKEGKILVVDQYALKDG
jgi:hypothetical protein